MKQPNEEFSDPTALMGLIFSVLGLVGWLSIVVFLLAFPYSETRDIDNFFSFLRNVIIVGIGGVLCGLSSFIGIITSCIAAARRRQPQMAYLGLALSLSGIAVGGPVLLWRLNVIFG